MLIPYPTYKEPHCGSSVIPLLGKLKPVTNHKVLPSWTCPIQQPLVLMNINPEDCQCLLQSTCDLQIVGHRLLSIFCSGVHFGSTLPARGMGCIGVRMNACWENMLSHWEHASLMGLKDGITWDFP